MITWNLLRFTSFFDCVWIGPAAFVAGPVTIFEKKVMSLRYRTCTGETIRAQLNGAEVHQFVPSIDHVIVPRSLQYSCDKMRERVGVPDLRTYLITALKTGSCIIVRRNASSLFIQCNKLSYILDSDTLEVRDIQER